MTLLPLLVFFSTDGKGEVCVLFIGQPQSSFSFIFSHDFLNCHLWRGKINKSHAITSTHHFTSTEHNLLTHLNHYLDWSLSSRQAFWMFPRCKPKASRKVFLLFFVFFHSYSFALLTNISVTFNVPLSGLSIKLLVLVYVSSTLIFHILERNYLFFFFFFLFKETDGAPQIFYSRAFSSSHSCCIIYSFILKMLKNPSGKDGGRLPHFSINTVCGNSNFWSPLVIHE